MTRYHLRNGYQIFPTHSGGSRWCLSTPEISFQWINGPADVLTEVVGKLYTGNLDDRELTIAGRELVAALTERGVLRRADERPVHAVIGLDDEDGSASELAGLFSQAGFNVRILDALTSDLSVVTALVVTAPVQRDARWRSVDERCASAGVSWHRAYPEGSTTVVGPYSVPGHTASYRDCRGRQLAATRTPDEMEALWGHLDQVVINSGQERTPPGAMTVAAGMIAIDVVAHLSGELLPGAGTQRVHRWDDGAVTCHPVLPLPELSYR